ncbi:hypothetical protein KIL84_022074 [Mauremys mutica]|uniref:Uncharacterized protein n=1 Tax=Mauremys mutica TaxID=74926 RepID=A0A9D4B3W3_9SAUR|nr:hypothetical protein KIL84_022074 [Mauremys mutica]
MSPLHCAVQCHTLGLTLMHLPSALCLPAALMESQASSRAAETQQDSSCIYRPAAAVVPDISTKAGSLFHAPWADTLPASSLLEIEAALCSTHFSAGSLEQRGMWLGFGGMRGSWRNGRCRVMGRRMENPTPNSPSGCLRLTCPSLLQTSPLPLLSSALGHPLHCLSPSSSPHVLPTARKGKIGDSHW